MKINYQDKLKDRLTPGLHYRRHRCKNFYCVLQKNKNKKIINFIVIVVPYAVVVKIFKLTDFKRH